MRTIMIHEVDKKILSFMIEHIKDTDILTFDDGLFSCFYYWPGLRDLFPKNKKIFFISTGLVRQDDSVGEKDMTCEDALYSFSKTTDRSSYMSWKEIKIIREEGGIIGGHGHLHFGKYKTSLVSSLGAELEQMKEEFEKNLGSSYSLEYYACPYNKNHRIEQAFLGKDVEILGRERYDIRELMGRPGYKQNEYRTRNTD